jgi:protein-ribulosamine 3-kinase
MESHLLDHSIVKSFENLYKLLPSLLPVEVPALVHGDLWSGNVIIDQLGSPCLIDPAVHYGNREAELAFTQLFGGFDDVFYNSYHEAFKLQNGFQQRADLYNLYPLLVHVNLFGGGYVQQVRSILKKFD